MTSYKLNENSPHICPVCRLPYRTYEGVLRHWRYKHVGVSKPSKEACKNPHYKPKKPDVAEESIIGVRADGTGVASKYAHNPPKGLKKTRVGKYCVVEKSNA